MSLKKNLREKSMRTIMECSSSERLKPTFVELFTNLANYNESLFVALECLKKPGQVAFCTKIMQLLENILNKKKFSKDEKIKFGNVFLEVISNQLPFPNAKFDLQIIQFIVSAAQVSHFIAEEITEIIKEGKNFDTIIAQNNYVQAYLILIYNFSHYMELRSIVKPFMSSKLSYNATSIATLITYANENVFGDKQPTIKSIISLFKSACDNGMCDVIVSAFMACLTKYMTAQAAKECASIVPLLLKKTKKENDTMCEFGNFLMSLMNFDDTTSVIKSMSEDIIGAYLLTVNNTAEIGGELTDPLSYVCNDIAQSFIKICAKFSIDECNYLQQKASNYPTGVLLLSIFICRVVDVKKFESTNRETMLADLTDACPQNSPNFQLLIALSGYFVVNFNSRRGLEILVTGLTIGSRQACNWIVSEEMSFQTVFPELASEFDPDKSGQLYLNTLISLLQANVQQQPDELPADDSVTAYSDSNFDSISGMSRYSSDSLVPVDLQGVPTPETTLFCTTISRYIDHPELVTLLPLAAAAISPTFASDFTKNMKAQKRKRSKLELIASYSNSLQSLELQTLHALAQTFLLLSPGMSMLFLAVSLQRLPRDIIKSMLQKTTAFAASSPDFFARMVALVSHSHPDIALSFLDSFIDSSIQKRRIFFFLRSAAEDNEQNAIAIFKCIGYCSGFVDSNCFSNDFLPFATRFLNKHLTHQSKTIDLFQAELFAIKKLSQRLVQHQEQNSDHVFPFKDFLIQFVCAYYMDVGENIIGNNSQQAMIVPLCLQTLASLLPVHPIRGNDKHERSIEMTAYIMQNAKEEEFQTIFKSASLFFTELLKTNPSVYIISGILTPFVTNILSNKYWKEITKLMAQVCSQWEKVKLTQGSAYLSQLVSQFGLLLTSVLPLLSSECSSDALSIVGSVCSLQCTIRNQILSLPRSIRPTLPTITDETPDEVASIGCAFTSKNLLTSQVFEIIMGLLEYASEGKILPIHERSCVLCVLYLLRERGSEEFRYDSNIVSFLVKAAKRSEEVLSVCLEIFKELGGMRFYSIVSAIFMQKDEVVPILPKVISALLENENATMSLLSVVSNMSVDETADSSWFTKVVLPQLSGAISQTSDDDFAKLFFGVAKLTKSMTSPIFFSLFGGTNMKELLKGVEQERPLVFPLILTLLPEDYDKYFSLLSLQFAEVSEESCNAYLAYFFNDVREPDDETFVLLNNIMKANPLDAWNTQSQHLAMLIADNISSFKSAIECANTYITNCDEDSLTFIWSSIVSHVVSDFDNWIDVLSTLSYRIDVLSFGPIIPQLVVRAKDQKSANLIGKIAGIFKKSDNKKIDDVELLLTSDLFSNCDFVSEFVGMLKHGEYVTESIAALSIICSKVTPANAYAIEAIIDEVANIKCDEDDTCAISVLQDLIF